MCNVNELLLKTSTAWYTFIGGPKGLPPSAGGLSPATFVLRGILVRELSIFADESGDKTDHSRYFLLTLVAHDQEGEVYPLAALEDCSRLREERPAQPSGKHRCIPTAFLHCLSISALPHSGQDFLSNPLKKAASSNGSYPNKYMLL